jgi:hypothetical protein
MPVSAALRRLSPALSHKTELLILCARIGFNP